MYLLTTLFMTAPVMPMQGRMEETARARRHERTYATGTRVSRCSEIHKGRLTDEAGEKCAYEMDDDCGRCYLLY